MRTALLKDGGLAPRIHLGCSLGSVCVRNYHRRLRANFLLLDQSVTA